MILALFIWTIYMGLSYVLSRWQYEIVTSDLLTLIRNREFISSLKWFFTPTYLVLLPTIGIFLDRQMGWFLITSFFYFVISRLGFFLLDSKSLELMEIVTLLLILVFFTLLLLIMNKEKIRNERYHIAHQKALSKNIISSLIGMGITILVVYLKG